MTACLSGSKQAKMKRKALHRRMQKQNDKNPALCSGTKEITVIGGGLAGCEAAWQASRLGVRVKLYEMRPQRMTEAHKGAGLAELVCSNSLRSKELSTGPGLLKKELEAAGSLIIGVRRRQGALFRIYHQGHRE